MKFLKADGTVEDGTPLTDEAAEQMQKTEELLHVVLCKNSHHYDWQGIPACKIVANAVALRSDNDRSSRRVEAEANSRA